MNDHYFDQPPRRVSFWRRLFGGRREPEYFPPPYSAPEYAPAPEPEPEPAPAPAPPPPPPPPPPASRNFHLSLPSRKPQLTFGCGINVSFEPMQPGQVLKDPESAIQLDVYKIANQIASKLSLTEHEQLGFRITDQLHRRSLAGAGLVYWGRCVSVSTKAHELELVRSLEQREIAWETERQEDWIVQHRVKTLKRVFDDPRIATIWWFAQHQDRLEELPDKARLFADLDRWFNPRHYSLAAESQEHEMEPEAEFDEPEDPVFSEPEYPSDFEETPMPDPGASTDGQLLDQFLLDADEAGRAAIGVVLSKLYRNNGRDDLADRMQQYAQPSSPTSPMGNRRFDDEAQFHDGGPIAL